MTLREVEFAYAAAANRHATQTVNDGPPVYPPNPHNEKESKKCLAPPSAKPTLARSQKVVPFV